MANRYWVGGTGTWTSSSTTNWSASSGGASGATAPTSVDDVFFDANSNTGTNPFTLTIGSNATCRGWSVNGVDGLMTIAGSVNNFSVYGDIFLQATNLSVTFSGVIRLRTTVTGTFFITTNGNPLSSLRVETNSGTTYRLASNITLNGNLYPNIELISGTLNLNTWNAVLSGTSVGNIIGSGSLSRTLTLGSSTVDCYSTTSPILLSGSNYSISASSSTLIFYGSSASINESIATSYGTVNFYPPSAIGTRSLVTSSSFNILRVYTGTVAGIYPFTVNSNISINSLQLYGSGSNPAIRHNFSSNVAGTARTISATTSFAFEYVDFKDIISASATWSGTSIGTLGNTTTNITASPAKTVYWNLAGTQNWSATGWAASSGGTPALANFPIAQDTVVFDDNGAAGTVTVDANYNIATLNTSGRTLPVTINVSGFLYLFRSLTLGSGLTSSGILIFTGNLISQIIANGNTTNWQIRWEKNPGTVGGISGGAFVSTNDFTVTTGTFQTGGNNFTVRAFSANGSGTKILSFSSSTLNITGSGVSFNLFGTSNTTFSANTATLLFSSASAKFLYSVPAFSFSNLIQNGAGALSMLGVNCTTISTNVLPTTIEFFQSNTFTNFNLNGTPGNLVTLKRSAGNVSYTLRAVIITSSPSTRKILDYVNVEGLQFESPGAGVNTVNWYATNSINSGNNQGILFSDTSKKILYILGGTTFVLPSDWNPNNNRIFLVGGGGSGGQSFSTSSGGGGGGGGFTLVQNYAAPPGTTVSYSVGNGGYYSNGGSTTWVTAGYPSLFAGGGGGAPYTTFPYNAGGTGGVGSTFNGGNGGIGIASIGNSNFTLGGGGGGGSGGPLGNGAVGGNGFQSSFSSTNGAGGGGGGNGGGFAGQNGTSAFGGVGGNNASGVGGGAGSNSISNPGFAGGGAGGSTQSSYSPQLIPSTGSDIAGSFGTGGGAGGAGWFQGNPAFYDFANSANGAGGGGAGYYFGSNSNPGQGGNGIIVVEYTPNTDFLMFMSAR